MRLKKFWGWIGAHLDILIFMISLYVLIACSVISAVRPDVISPQTPVVINGVLMLMSTIMIYIFYLIKLKPRENGEQEIVHHHFNDGMRNVLSDKKNQSISTIDIFGFTSLQFHSLLFEDGDNRKISNVRLLLPSESSVERYLKQVSEKEGIKFDDAMLSYRNEFAVVKERWVEAVDSNKVERFYVKETDIFPYFYFSIINKLSFLYGFYKHKSGTHGVDTDKVFLDTSGCKTSFIKPGSEQHIFDQLWCSAKEHQNFNRR